MSSFDMGKSDAETQFLFPYRQPDPKKKPQPGALHPKRRTCSTGQQAAYAQGLRSQAPAGEGILSQVQVGREQRVHRLTKGKAAEFTDAINRRATSGHSASATTTAL